MNVPGPTKRGSRARGWWLLGVVVGVAVLTAGCIPEGTHTVSSFGAGGVPPGEWHSLGAVNSSCMWRTGRDLPHYDPGEVPLLPVDGGWVGGLSAQGPVWAEIAPTDPEFLAAGCFPFWQEPGPFARPLNTPGTPFGPGDYKVGYELAPGTYRATGTYPCTWFRVSSFQGTRASIIEGKTETGTPPPEVTIEPGDYGFKSQWCGTWTKVG